jgi:hypothetical protein
MTGTPLDLTPFGPLLGAAGWLYWVVAIVAIVLVLRMPRPRRIKFPLAALVLAAALLPQLRESVITNEKRDQARARLNESMALFQERCKSAGEKITRTVNNVDGVVWMRWREKYGNEDNFADQWNLNDPYGRDCGMEDCIANLLRVTNGASLNPEAAQRHRAGYRFVETTDPRDGLRYRYSAHLAHSWTQEEIERRLRDSGRELPQYEYRFKTERIPTERFSARYGVTWEDISSREDRKHWIAGSSLKVLDLETNEVIGERIGYMIDRGQGSQVGLGPITSSSPSIQTLPLYLPPTLFSPPLI